MRTLRFRWAVACIVSLSLCLLIVGFASAKNPGSIITKQVTIPPADHFTPMTLTVHAGDTVKWVNDDTDDHTVVRDDAMSTTGMAGTNVIVKGTNSNGGKPGSYSLRFLRPGTFVYYCRFHAMLDSANQPIAPGPDGGIQDANGNFGTPMMGVITVLPREDTGGK